jgi:predicted acyltransferase
MSNTPSPSTLSPTARPSGAKASGSGARLISLDALRGFDMFWIMSGEQIVHALARATGWPIFTVMSDQLHHTVWNGFTFYDMIFPLFLFIAGTALPLSLQKKVQQAGVPTAHYFTAEVKRQLIGTMLRRTLILVLLGLVVNGALRFNGLENTRFPSVLARIGIAWFFAGLIYLGGGLRWQIGWLIGLLLGYWAVMSWVPVPGFGAGVLTMQGSLESYIDRLLLPGRLHDGIHDPEGVLSTIPAIGTALLGVLTGSFLQWDSAPQGRSPSTASFNASSSASSNVPSTAWPMWKKAAALAVAGALLVLLGYAWGFAFPINKRLWTSSFVLYAGGFSLLLLSIFYAIIDVGGYKKWAFPFVVIGSNSILIYVASEGAIDFAHTANYFFGGLIHLSPLNGQQVWTAISVTLVQWIFLYILYKKKIFLKV